MLLAKLLGLGAGAASSGSTDARYSLKLWPGRSNECLDADLDSIEAVLNQLLVRQLPYEPYKSRFNALQADAEVFRAVFPRPLPGEPDAMVTKSMTEDQWDAIERLKTGLVTLRSDLGRASQLFDDIKALPAETPRQPRVSLPGLRGFLAGMVALPVIGSAPAVQVVRPDYSQEAMLALRDGRLDDAAAQLRFAQNLASGVWGALSKPTELKLGTAASGA